MGTTVTQLMKRAIIKFRDNPKLRDEWRNFCNDIDGDATYEQIVGKLLQYFEEHPSEKKQLRRTDQPPEFR